MELLEVAAHVEDLAREAGDILLEHFEHIDQIDYKGLGDPVTAADRASERFLRGALEQAYPDVPFYGEEFGFGEGAARGSNERCWIVDPLDGTVNYATRTPIFCVSIALFRFGSPVVGVVYDPTRGEMYSAVAGNGCTRDGKPCHTSDRDPLDHMAPIGVSSDVIRVRPRFLEELSKGRSLGSAALQLAYVARGAYAAAMDPYTRLWDVAAGALLVTEAGGVATHMNGEPLFALASDDPAFRGVRFNYLASNGQRHVDLAALTSEVDFEKADPRNR